MGEKPGPSPEGMGIKQEEINDKEKAERLFDEGKELAHSIRGILGEKGYNLDQEVAPGPGSGVDLLEKGNVDDPEEIKIQLIRDRKGEEPYLQITHILKEDGGYAGRGTVSHLQIEKDGSMLLIEDIYTPVPRGTVGSFMSALGFAKPIEHKIYGNVKPGRRLRQGGDIREFPGYGTKKPEILLQKADEVLKIVNSLPSKS